MRAKSVFYASENLRRLYRERVGDSMTQAQFAKRYGIGGQSMLAMILGGSKPLPIETAPKLARALRCSIYEICPEMAEFIREDLLPTLGKNLRRAAVWLFLVASSLLAPQQADAGLICHNASLSTHWRAFWTRWRGAALALVAGYLARLARRWWVRSASRMPDGALSPT